MTPIRPNLPPPTPPAQGPRASDAGRLAAQKAFFEIAAGRGPAPAPQAPATAAAEPAARLDRPTAPAAAAAVQAGEPPPRPLRPGSLLDIRV